MGVVRGALGPQLEKTIKEQLSYEHKVMEGKAERKTVLSITTFINKQHNKHIH